METTLMGKYVKNIKSGKLLGKIQIKYIQI